MMKSGTPSNLSPLDVAKCLSTYRRFFTAFSMALVSEVRLIPSMLSTCDCAKETDGSEY